MKPALSLELIKNCKSTKARVCDLYLPHGKCQLPMFMPVGTQGTLKGMTPHQLEQVECQLILANTYHLGHRPGPELLIKANGLHNFMKWNRPILTDSGGFQMVSLLKLAKITESGVEFQSPHDESMMLLTPEHSMQIQNAIGADIIMQLDDVISSTTTGERVEEAMYRSIRWLDRCIAGNKNPEKQNLFAIIQGGLDPELRKKCIKEMVKRDTPGYAIGGLSGGESKEDFWRIVSLCTDLLPKNKPIYCMGVGYPEDLVVCTALGVDMFDCVFPTRTARFGNGLTFNGTISLKQEKYKYDPRPLEPGCDCSTCKTYSRALLHTLVNRDTNGCHLVTVHNLRFMMKLMAGIRKAVLDDKLPNFVKRFFKNYYSDSKEYPEWARNALQSVGIALE